MDIQNHTIGTAEAGAHFAELIEKVAAGEEFTITKNGLPVARILPTFGKSKVTPEERAAAMKHWLESSKGLSLGGLKIKDLIAEGRR